MTTLNKLRDLFANHRLLCKAIADGISAGDIKQDYNGHENGRYDSVFHKKDKMKYFIEYHLSNLLCEKEDTELLLEAIKNKKSIDRFVFLGGQYTSHSCEECGEKYGIEFDGITARATTICKYPKGAPPFKFKVSFPSGRIAIGNSIRKYYPEPPERTIITANSRTIEEQIKEYESWSVNNRVGQRNVSLFHASNNFVHFFVSNQQCLVHKLDDSILIGRAGDEGEEIEKEIPLPGKKIGNITTDLWWASIADFEELKTKFPPEMQNLTNKELKDKHHIDIAKIKAGEYEFTVFPQNVYADYDKPAIYGKGIKI